MVFNTYTKLCDVTYIKNADGSYTKLLTNISDLQTIDAEPPDGDFGLHGEGAEAKKADYKGR